MGMDGYGYGRSMGYGSRRKTPGPPHLQPPFRLLPRHDFSSALPHMNIEESFIVSSVNRTDRQGYIRSKGGNRPMVLKLNNLPRYTVSRKCRPKRARPQNRRL